MRDLIYLDTNATTPLAPEVQQAVCSAMSNAWGNVSSAHIYGQKAKECVEKARKQTAEMINAQPSEIIFMSGGTEVNHAVLNTFLKTKNLGCHGGQGDKLPSPNIVPHIITSTIEHDSVRKPLLQFSSEGLLQVSFVEVDKQSHAVKVEDVMKAIRPNTVLVTVMLANNETGVFQPIKELSEAIREHNQASTQKIYLHTDAAQALGKVPVCVDDLGVDYLTIVGHKFYGPRIGALYIRGLGNDAGCPLKPVFFGGGQEGKYRAGTENTAMIVGLGMACELASKNILSYQYHMKSTRDALESKLSQRFQSMIEFNCSSSQRLPNTCSVSLVGERFVGRKVLESCERVVAGVGSACHSSDPNCDGSSVLIASGISTEMARNAIRLSVGRDTTLQCITAAVDDIWNATQKLVKQRSLG